jgi:hypothetical protein
VQASAGVRRVASWLIVRSRAVDPVTPGVDSAYSVTLSLDASVHELIVEFAAPSSLTSVGYAEEVARRFLASPEPPRHLIVRVDGTVSIYEATRS